MQPRSLIEAHRYLDSENLQRLVDDRLERKLPPHVSPFSCLIAAMGNNWMPGCKEAVDAMAKYAFNEGYTVEWYEEHDRCYNPYDALGIMRNMAYRRALDEGFEWICYVDNDVKPAKETLVSLMHRFCPVIMPIIEYPSRVVAFGSGPEKRAIMDSIDVNEEIIVEETANTLKIMPHYGLHSVRAERNQGLALVGANILSFMLCQTRVFQPWALHPFWSSEIGADESYHFQQLSLLGHRPFLDTNVVVPCLKPPTFPLDHKPERK